jgi:hypothetical protein
MCKECGETGHSANKCPIRPCNACGLQVTDYKRAICVQNTCALYVTAKNCQKVTTTIYADVQSAQKCKLFGHVAKDCGYANCLDVDVDWFNLLFTKSKSTVQQRPCCCEHYSPQPQLRSQNGGYIPPQEFSLGTHRHPGLVRTLLCLQKNSRRIIIRQCADGKQGGTQPYESESLFTASRKRPYGVSIALSS